MYCSQKFSISWTASLPPSSRSSWKPAGTSTWGTNFRFILGPWFSFLEQKFDFIPQKSSKIMALLWKFFFFLKAFIVLAMHRHYRICQKPPVLQFNSSMRRWNSSLVCAVRTQSLLQEEGCIFFSSLECPFKSLSYINFPVFLSLRHVVTGLKSYDPNLQHFFCLFVTHLVYEGLNTQTELYLRPGNPITVKLMFRKQTVKQTDRVSSLLCF